MAYAIADSAGATAGSSGGDTVSWGQIVLGALLLVLARRQWAKRPAPGEPPVMPKWMARIDDLSPVQALGIGALLAGVNPKNLALTLAAATGLAQLGVTGSDATVALVVFVVVASLTIALPVGYRLVGGDGARAKLDELREWLGVNNSAVMAVLLLVFGVDLWRRGSAC